MADTPAHRGPRRGLGRGLSVLLGEQGQREGSPDPDAASDIRTIPLHDIAPHPDQPRRRIDPAALETLATSIAQHGLMQPVVVREVDGGYQLIAGERRWRAAQKAGLEHIPALVREADERLRLEMALVENVVREDLSPIEVANAVAVLVEDFGQSHQQIATHLGRSRPAVSNLLRLLELPDEVQRMVDSGALTEGHGRAILMAEGAKNRKRLAESASQGEWSVRELERRARSISTPKPDADANSPGRVAHSADALIDQATDAFVAAFEAPVRVRRARREVVVELRFADDEGLRQALARLA